MVILHTNHGDITLELDAENAPATVANFLQYVRDGHYDNARIVLETAVRAAPDWAVAHENLGDVYARLAAAEYNRAATLDKGNKTAPAKLVLARQLLAPK